MLFKRKKTFSKQDLNQVVLLEYIHNDLSLEKLLQNNQYFFHEIFLPTLLLEDNLKFKLVQKLLKDMLKIDNQTQQKEFLDFLNKQDISLLWEITNNYVAFSYYSVIHQIFWKTSLENKELSKQMSLISTINAYFNDSRNILFCSSSETINHKVIQSLLLNLNKDISIQVYNYPFSFKAPKKGILKENKSDTPTHLLRLLPDCMMTVLNKDSFNDTLNIMDGGTQLILSKTGVNLDDIFNQVNKLSSDIEQINEFQKKIDCVVYINQDNNGISYIEHAIEVFEWNKVNVISEPIIVY